MTLQHTIVRDPTTGRLDSRNPLGQSDPVPTKVVDVQQTGATSSSVTLSWSAATDADTYNVYVDSIDTPTQTGVTGTSTTLTGLTAETGYSVRVSGENEVGEGELSDPVTMNTSATDTEGDLSVLKAFPTAEGSGALSEGGRGGTVIYVTNLNDSGTGSLRAAVDASGPRIVVFRVSGTIVLQTRLSIWNPYITIAGQTAPGGGIQIAGKVPGTIPDEGSSGPTVQMDNDLIWIQTHDVVIRYLRLRKGYVGYSANNVAHGGPIAILNISPLSSRNHVENIIIDHVSAMWGGHMSLRVFDTVGERRVQNISIQDSIFAEPMYGKAQMAFGSRTSTDGLYPTAGAEMGNIDVHRNLLSTSFGRVPKVYNWGFSGAFRYINNISYNTCCELARVDEQLNYATPCDFIGNIFDHGPVHWSSTRGCYEMGVSPNIEGVFPTIYASGNFGDRHQYDDYNMVGHPPLGGSADCSSPLAPDTYRRTAPNPSPAIPVGVVDVDLLEDQILPTIGASRRLDENGQWVGNRDSVDTRVVEQGYINRTQDFLVTHEDEVGGYPTLAAGTAYTSTADDGIADGWKTANGLDINTDYSATTVPGLVGWTYMDLFLAGMSVPN